MGVFRLLLPRGAVPRVWTVLPLLVAAGCTTATNKPLGSGDDLIVDVDATPAPPNPRDEDVSSEDSPFGALDGPYGVLADAYGPLAVCSQCACGSGTYCFGGDSTAVFSGQCNQAASGTDLAIGCQPLPAACANEPDCVCLLKAVGSSLPCGAPLCVDSDGFAVYCTSP